MISGAKINRIFFTLGYKKVIFTLMECYFYVNGTLMELK